MGLTTYTITRELYGQTFLFLVIETMCCSIIQCFLLSFGKLWVALLLNLGDCYDIARYVVLLNDDKFRRLLCDSTSFLRFIHHHVTVLISNSIYSHCFVFYATLVLEFNKVFDIIVTKANSSEHWM